MIDITAIIVFHDEGPLAVASMKSFHVVVERARARGLNVQSLIVMDRPTKATSDIVYQQSIVLDEVVEVDFGDLSLTRMAGISRSAGRWIACFDGDDLWGADWLTNAWKAASSDGRASIWHPEYLLYFDERDCDCNSLTNVPLPGTRAFFMKQQSSGDSGFDPSAIFIENLWSAHCLCMRELYDAFPYRPFERRRGLGVEDWSWNAETLFGGVHHEIVPSTVHCIRLKEVGSLGIANGRLGLLPHLSDTTLSKFYEK